MLEDAYERIITALTVWREARGESTDARLGVWWVIRNRVADPRWPSRYSAVCLQAKQFSCHNPDDPNSSKLPAWNDAAWNACCDVVESAGVVDPTAGANHYHSGPAVAKWAVQNQQHVTCRIGAFTFYKL